MGEKKQVPLRISRELFDALSRWADDDFRSLNGQIEYLLTECVRKSGREKKIKAEEEWLYSPFASSPERRRILPAKNAAVHRREYKWNKRPYVGGHCSVGTKLANPEKQVFVLQFPVGEFDMVIFDPAQGNCRIFEIKHSTEILPQQYRIWRTKRNVLSQNTDMAQL